MGTEVERIELVVTTDNQEAVKALKKIQKELGDTGGKADKASAKLSKFGGAAKASLGALGVGVGVAAVAAFGVSMIKMAGDAEKALSEVATLADFTTKELARMRVGTRLLAVQFGQSFQAISKSRFDVVSSGFESVGEQQDLLAKGMKLGVANATDVSVAIQSLTGTLGAFNLPASAAAETMDRLTVIAGGSKTNLEGLAGAIAKAAPAANSAQQNLRTVGAALDVMTLAGISAEESATSLKAAFRSIAKPDIQAALKKQNIEVKDSSGNFREFRSILGDLAQFPTEKIKTLFPSEEAQESIGILISQIDKFDSKLEALTTKNIAGATEARFQEVSNTLNFQLSRVAQAWEAALNSAVDEGLLGALTSAARGVADFIQEGLVAEEVKQIRELQQAMAPLIEREQELLALRREGRGGAMVDAEIAAIEASTKKVQAQISALGKSLRGEEERKAEADAVVATEKKEKAIAEAALTKRKQLNESLRRLELQAQIDNAKTAVEREEIKWNEIIRVAKEGLATREQLVRLNALKEGAIARAEKAEAEKREKELANKQRKALAAKLSLEEKIRNRKSEIEQRGASKTERIFREEAAKEDDIVKAADLLYAKGQMTRARLNEIVIESENRLRDSVADRVAAEAPEEDRRQKKEEEEDPFAIFNQGLEKLNGALPELGEGMTDIIKTQMIMEKASEAAGAALIDEAVAGKLSGKALVKAAQTAAVGVLKAKASEAAGLAIFELASAAASFAQAIFGNPAAAAAGQQHLVAAAGYMKTAAIAGGLAAGIGGAGGGGGGGAGAQGDVERAQRRRRDADLDERNGIGSGVQIVNNISLVGAANRSQLDIIADLNAQAARRQFDTQQVTQNLGTVSGQ